MCVGNPPLLHAHALQIGEEVRAVLGPYGRYTEMVPTLTGPVVLGCALPGGLHFLSVRAPGPLPLAADEATASATELRSGRPGQGRYCKVLVDAQGFVRGIVCLADKVHHLFCLQYPTWRT